MRTPRQITVAALVEPGELRRGELHRHRSTATWWSRAAGCSGWARSSRSAPSSASARRGCAPPSRAWSPRAGSRGCARAAELLPADRGGAARVRRRRRAGLRPAAAAGRVADRRGRGGRGLRSARRRSGDRTGRRGAARRGARLRGELAAGQGGAAPLRRGALGARGAGRGLRRLSRPLRAARCRASGERTRRASSPGRSSCMPSAPWCCATRGCRPRRCPATGPRRGRGRFSPGSTASFRRRPIRSSPRSSPASTGRCRQRPRRPGGGSPARGAVTL